MRVLHRTSYRSVYIPARAGNNLSAVIYMRRPGSTLNMSPLAGQTKLTELVNLLRTIGASNEAAHHLLPRRPFYPIAHRLPNFSVYVLIRLTNEVVGASIMHLLDAANDHVREHLDHIGNSVVNQESRGTAFMYSAGGVRLLVDNIGDHHLTYKSLSRALITLIDYFQIHSSTWSTAQFEIHEGSRRLAVGLVVPAAVGALSPRQNQGRKCHSKPSGRTYVPH